MATKRKTTKNPILTKSRALLDLKNAYFALYKKAHSPGASQAEKLRLNKRIVGLIASAVQAGASHADCVEASNTAWNKYQAGRISRANPRAHIPTLRGRGRPAKKRRKTTLEWTDRKGHKHHLEFKGHSVESMKQLATSMVANGETSSVIVDY